MANAPAFLAIDLGAESGRAVLGQLDEKLTIQEIHRFPNGGVRLGDSLHWDILRLWSEMQAALRLASVAGTVSSLGVDTWGVDFGLLNKADRLIGNPYHYRDSRTDRILDTVCAQIPRCEIYRQTGIQVMAINTLFQLFAMRQAHDPQLDMARALLNMPDLFNFWLTGERNSEFTIASTTQCLSMTQKDWTRDLLERLDIPIEIFQPIIQPGTILGSVRPWISAETGCGAVPVIAVAGHDTASAVVAIPADDDDFAYISSGTWSLIGVESTVPIIHRASLDADFANEGGVGGKIRFQKNLMGLWLLQECRRDWARQGKEYSYADLTELAASAPPHHSLVFPANPIFLPPGGMVTRIQAFCHASGQPVPQDVGQITRCILESLALEYRWNLDCLRNLTGKSLPVLHIVGGGSRNRLLNQLTADVTGCTVLSGPVEATSLGNILMQAIALGQVASIGAGRALVRASVEIETFSPANTGNCETAYARYLQLRQHQSG
jgi:rhamnulokinase